MIPAPQMAGHVIPTTPFPPMGGAMDHTLQVVFSVMLWSIAAVLVVIALRDWRRTDSPFALLVLIGGCLCVAIEPIVDILGLCWFFPTGQFVGFEAFGRPIPIWMVPVYLGYVGGLALYTYSQFERGKTMVGVFKLYAIFALIGIAVEEPPLHMGLYVYYGTQPFREVMLPLWWVIANGAMPIVLGALLYKLKPHLSGWKLLLIVPLMPMGDALANGATAWPVWIALNSSSSMAITTAAAVVMLGLGLIVTWVAAIAVATDSPARGSLATAG